MAVAPFNLNTLISGGYNPGYVAPAAPKAAAPAAKPAAAPAAPAGKSIYWIGSNGHVYLKGSGGNGAAVSDLGLAGNVQTSKLNGAYQIDDPNAPKAAATVSGGSGSSGPVYEDKSNDISQQNAALDAVQGGIDAGNKQVQAALDLIMGKYSTEDAAESASTKANSDQNSVNLTKNQQTAYVNAAQGHQGLNATLASLGALNGTGVTLANRAVQKGANEDLTGAQDNFDTNSKAITDADSLYQTQDKERKDDANSAAGTARTRVQNQAYQQQLGYYQQLSNDYAAEGDSGNASKFTGLANALFPQIQATTVPDATPTYTSAAYTAPSLASYLAGNSTQVNTTPASGAPGSLPGLVATNVKKKVTAATPALATV